MNWTNLNLRTLIPEVPNIFNNNFLSFKRYLDVIYNEITGVIVVPISTTGRIKGATIEGVTGVFDNLIVRNQFTNLYNNITTADLDFINTYLGADVSTRDASTTLGENITFKWVDLNKPYYKIGNDVSYGFRTTNISQEFQLIFDASGTTSFRVYIDPSNYMSINASDASITWIKLICIDFDASLGPYWIVKQYGGTYTINLL